MLMGGLPLKSFEPILEWTVDLDYTMGPRAWLGKRTPFPTIFLPLNTSPQQRDLIFWAYEQGFMVGRQKGEARVREGMRELLGMPRA